MLDILLYDEQQGQLTRTSSNTIGGKITTGDPICRAGGSSAEDVICTVPDIVELDVTLTKL